MGQPGTDHYIDAIERQLWVDSAYRDGLLLADSGPSREAAIGQKPSFAPHRFGLKSAFCSEHNHRTSTEATL